MWCSTLHGEFLLVFISQYPSPSWSLATPNLHLTGVLGYSNRFRKCKVDCLDDIAKVVEETAEVNEVLLVSTQSGEVLVPTYDWATFFDKPFNQTALKGIKSFHHFLFTSNHPGHVFVKSAADQPRKKINMLSDLNWPFIPSELPPVVKPNGLSYERKQYLFEKIREFCRPEVRDDVCPQPDGYLDAVLDPLVQAQTPPSPEHPPPAKKQRACSQCKQKGHNKRRCPQLKKI